MQPVQPAVVGHEHNCCRGMVAIGTESSAAVSAAGSFIGSTGHCLCFRSRYFTLLPWRPASRELPARKGRFQRSAKPSDPLIEVRPCPAPFVRQRGVRTAPNRQWAAMRGQGFHPTAPPPSAVCRSCRAAGFSLPSAGLPPRAGMASDFHSQGGSQPEASEASLTGDSEEPSLSESGSGRRDGGPRSGAGDRRCLAHVRLARRAHNAAMRFMQAPLRQSRGLASGARAQPPAAVPSTACTGAQRCTRRLRGRCRGWVRAARAGVRLLGASPPLSCLAPALHLSTAEPPASGCAGGPFCATPKAILDMMGVEGLNLTSEHACQPPPTFEWACRTALQLLLLLLKGPRGLWEPSRDACRREEPPAEAPHQGAEARAAQGGRGRGGCRGSCIRGGSASQLHRSSRPRPGCGARHSAWPHAAQPPAAGAQHGAAVSCRRRWGPASVPLQGALLQSAPWFDPNSG